MSIEDCELLLIYVAAPAQTLFVLGFGLTNHWWTSLIGRAVFTKALSVALLLDLAVFVNLFGPDYPHRALITLAVVALITLGVYMQLLAWAVEKVRHRKSGSTDRFSPGPDVPKL